MADGHATHDLEPLVAFVDGELDGSAHATIETRIASCRACARMAADLQAMKAATAAISAPTRTRDFRLTAADATRLVAIGPEPDLAQSRQATEMTERTTPHTTHDPELVAAAAIADRSLTDAERARAAEWFATCADCVDLRVDLLAIAAAERHLPTPARPRDYQLTDADAGRLRPAGWRGFVTRIGTSRDAITRPLAAGLTTLGLAGLILSGGGAALSGLDSVTSAADAAPADVTLSTVGAPIAAPAPDTSSSKGGPQVGVEGAGDPDGVFAGAGEVQASAAASAAPMTAASEAPLAESQRDLGETADDGADLAMRAIEVPSAGLPTAVIASLAFLVGGLGLFALRWMSRRRA